MKVWQVTRNYFDGDHDHGYYDYGLYETEETARKAAEKVAEFLVKKFDEWNKNTQWKSPKGSWKWMEKYPTIECSIGGDYPEYIQVEEKEVLTKIKEDIEKTMPIITYT